MALFQCLVICLLVLSLEKVHGFQTNIPNTELLTASNEEKNGKLFARENTKAISLNTSFQNRDCKYQNIADKSLSGPMVFEEIQNLETNEYTFYVRPKVNFGKLVLKMRLQSILKLDDVFYADETIELQSKDFGSHVGVWMKILIQYKRPYRRGPDSHQLQVTINNTTHSISSNHWRIMYTYEGFQISTDGGMELLLNCSPESVFPEENSSSNWIWSIVGCFVILLLLGGLCCGIVYIKKREIFQNSSTSPNSDVYEEFDEEMLTRIREKVVALREGRCCEVKCTENNSTVDKENHYVILMTPLYQPDVSNKPVTQEEDATPKENHYKIPKSLKTKGQITQDQHCQQNKRNAEYKIDEDHYETLYPLSNLIITTNNSDSHQHEPMSSKAPATIPIHTLTSPSLLVNKAVKEANEENHYEGIDIET